MTVYITKRPHYKYNYLANWQNPDTKAMMGQWFMTIKELKEYFKIAESDYIFMGCDNEEVFK